MKISRLFLVGVFVATAACGGGDGGGGNGGPSGSATATADPNATPTAPTSVGSAFFVRRTGDDDNDGRSATAAFRTIGKALASLPGLSSGRTIVVGPGTYNERLINTIPSGSAEQRVRLVADPTGVSTMDSPGPVILTSSGSGSIIRLVERQFITIDGFRVVGASGGNNAGIDIRTASQITVRNCEVTGGLSQADGIAVLGSNAVLLINNLVYENSRRGVRIAGGGSGSRGVRVINNTVARNGGQGIVVGTADAGSEAALYFNIIQDNVNAAILVTDPSVDLFSGDTNLVFPDRYDPEDLPRDFDINEDALFVDAEGGVYLLSDIDAGQDATSPAVDVGPLDIFPEDLLSELAAMKLRTTSTNGGPDEGDLDLGYHYPTIDGGPVEMERTFYVRATGDDSRGTGRSPADAFRNIRRALDIAAGGDMIIVGPGAYDSRLPVTVVGTEEKPLTIIGDESGIMTEDAPGAVIIPAAGRGLGFRVSGAAHVILDGFTILEASDAAIEVRGGSDSITVRNCFIDGEGAHVDEQGDGIRVDDSTNVSLINNLVTFNDANGILVRRSSATRIVNNTLGENGVRGIRIGSGSGAAADTFVQNNIVYFSGAVLIDVNDASAPTATLSHNLVFPASYRPLATAELPRPTDIDEDPGFVAFANFRLAAGSPARDAADAATDAVIRADLATRTTAEDETPDADALDIGYHFPIVPDVTPTPTSTPTP
jgi:parallel beta-helix repeat protein